MVKNKLIMSWQALGGKEAEIEARKQEILAGLKGIQTALSEAEKAIMEKGEQVHECERPSGW